MVGARAQNVFATIVWVRAFVYRAQWPSVDARTSPTDLQKLCRSVSFTIFFLFVVVVVFIASMTIYIYQSYTQYTLTGRAHIHTPART